MKMPIQKTSILLLVFMLLMSANKINSIKLPGNQILILSSGITKLRSVLEQKKYVPATLIAKTVTDINKIIEPSQLENK